MSEIFKIFISDASWELLNVYYRNCLKSKKYMLYLLLHEYFYLSCTSMRVDIPKFNTSKTHCILNSVVTIT